jgi:hypothetical protein
LDKKEEKEGDDDDADETKPLLKLVADKYPMSSVWYMIAIAFCAMRAATSFTVALAYLSIIFRVVQVVGFFQQKMILAYVGYGVSAFFILLMIFASIVNEND